MQNKEIKPQENDNIRKIIRSNGRPYSIRLNRDRIFTKEEWDKFYKTLSENQKFTFNFLISTGARIDEAINVKIKDIDFEEKKIHLTKVKKRNSSNSKVNTRKVKLPNELINHLNKIIKELNLKEEDKLPILSTPAANIAMKKALIKAEIKDWYMFSISNIRKTWKKGLK